MLCIKLVNYEDYTEIHGQRNKKKYIYYQATVCRRCVLAALRTVKLGLT